MLYYHTTIVKIDIYVFLFLLLIFAFYLCPPFDVLDLRYQIIHVVFVLFVFLRTTEKRKKKCNEQSLIC